MKPLLYFVAFALLLYSAMAVDIEKGTILAPSGINLTAELGMNITVDLLEVHSLGFAFNQSAYLINFTFAVQPDAIVNMTSFNFSSNKVDTYIIGQSYPANISGLIMNFTITGLPSNTSVIYAGAIIERETDGIFSINITNTSQKLSIKSTNILYLNLYDEQTYTLITEPVNLEFISDSYGLNLTYNNVADYPFEIPTGEYEIKYWAANYTKRSYYLSLDDNADIELILLKTTEGSYKSLQLVDESANVVEDATIKMQREYVDGVTSLFRTVEMTKTDERGKSFLFPELYDATYRFVIEYDGEVKKTTDKTELDTRDLYFKVTLLETGIDDFYDVAEYVTGDLSFNSTSNIWTFTYNDATNAQVSSARLIVTRHTLYSDTEIYSSTLSGTSGAISYNQSEYDGQTGEFVAVGYLNTADGNTYIQDTESHSYQASHLTFGLTGVLLSLLLILVFGAIGSYNPAAAIGMTMVGMAIAWFSGLWYIRLTWFIGLAITGLLFMQGTKT